MKTIKFVLIAMAFCAGAFAQSKPPLLSEPIVAALANELSGETAKRNLEFLSRQHRMRASRGFNAATEFIADQARSYGLDKVEILQFPADGKTMFGTQKSRMAWNADFAELWEIGTDGKPSTRIASWDAMPLVLAQDSESGNVTAEVVDVGAGTSESNYASKDVRGKLVLTSSQPAAVVPLAVEKYGAVGILSYAQNQQTAWYGENDNLIRWGHLDSFAKTKTFAFMLSLKQARGFQLRLLRGEKITMKAEVRAGQSVGTYDIATAVINGTDPKLKDEEIVFSCHLDHPRPGANDNASGCVTILEVARTFAKLIKEGKIERPRRTIRFVWPPEVEGTLVLLNGRPDLAKRIKAVIHMDMVGGGPETKAVFHVTRGPASLPSFVNDVAEAFGEFVNEESYKYAAGEGAKYPLVAPEGGKEPLNARMSEFTMGSDHEVYTDSSFGIPAIYLNDWPDRYIHTNFDVPANIDPTKLKRAGFIGAASGYFLANTTESDAVLLTHAIRVNCLRRTARSIERFTELNLPERSILTRFGLWYEQAIFESMRSFFDTPTSVKSEANEFFANLTTIAGPTTFSFAGERDGSLVYRRNPEIKGTMGAFGYDYFNDRYGAEKARSLKLPIYQGLRGSGGEYTYEVLNFVDGKRNVQQIRDAVSAEYGPVPLDMVLEYLKALESINVVQIVK
jgi:hypothetical protein